MTSAVLLMTTGMTAVAQTKPVTTASVSYKKQIAPIFSANCNACHSQATPQSGLNMTTSASLMKGGKRGAMVVPGDPSKSLLVAYIEGKKQPRMPIGGSCAFLLGTLLPIGPSKNTPCTKRIE